MVPFDPVEEFRRGFDGLFRRDAFGDSSHVFRSMNRRFNPLRFHTASVRESFGIELGQGFVGSHGCGLVR